MAKWRCTECHWAGGDDALLSAPHPFSDGDILTGCPQCFEANTMRRACDADGCEKEAGNGTPTQNGYVWSCFEHRPARS